jgi:hypothetical protein
MATTKANFKATNIFKNAILPFTKSKFLMGGVQHVAAEVIVSYVIRRLFKAERKKVIDLAMPHVLSLPLIGGVNGAWVYSEPMPQDKARLKDQAKEGAKQFPALVLGDICWKISNQGWHMPNYRGRELLIMFIAKVLTRPLIGTIYKSMPVGMAVNFDALDFLFLAQANSSKLDRRVRRLRGEHRKVYKASKRS